ncbi:MAG: Plug domain-containing protein [Aliidongia sp.]
MGLFAPSHAALAAGASDNGGIETIVVTAEKREEKVQDVPISIGVVSAQDIQQQGVVNVNDLGGKIANLSIELPFGPQEPQFSIRGVTETDYNQNQSSPIAMYVDGDFKSIGTLQQAQIYDIDRIEVERGPRVRSRVVTRRAAPSTSTRTGPAWTRNRARSWPASAITGATRRTAISTSRSTINWRSAAPGPPHRRRLFRQYRAGCAPTMAACPRCWTAPSASRRLEAEFRVQFHAARVAKLVESGQLRRLSAQHLAARHGHQERLARARGVGHDLDPVLQLARQFRDHSAIFL